jgi:hypothetical protein
MEKISKRGTDGRFAPGNRTGGRPKTKSTDYAAIIRQALTPEAAFEIIERAIADAKEGSPRAREWLFKHVVAPIPRTVLLSDSTTESRDALESDLTRMMSPEQILALDSFLAKRSERERDGES